MPQSETLGIMLMNLGGPDSPEAVRPFLYNLFSDRLIIKLGPSFMQKPLAWLIARKRAPKSMGYYNQIGGASPLLEITRAQGVELEKRLREHGDFRVFVGMRYWKPYMADAVKQAKAAGVTKLMGLSLYPQYSIATTGSSEMALASAIKEDDFTAQININPWYTHPIYIESLADLLNRAIKATSSGAKVLFSAHSLPKSFIDNGDPYVEHIKATIDALAQKVDMDWTLGYQSRSGPVEWLEPSTESVLQRLAGEGTKEVIVVPISFVSDHIETLYEIDILYKGMAEELGMNLSRVESLNTHPLFIRTLEDLVLKKSRQEGWV